MKKSIVVSLVLVILTLLFSVDRYLQGKNDNESIDKSNSKIAALVKNKERVTISTDFQVQLSPSQTTELLTETFGEGGDTQAPGINTRYCFEDQFDGINVACNGGVADVTVNDNEYTVTRIIFLPFSGWEARGVVKDHTSGGTNPNGRFFLINIGSFASSDPDPITRDVLYNVPLNNVIPNRPLIVTYFIRNIMKPGGVGSDPDLGAEIVQGFGTTGAKVIASETRSVLTTRGQWVEKSVTLNPGNNTRLNFLIRSYSTLYVGNDVAIDDISVYQLKPLKCSS
jgi:large repetitive protein